MTEPTPEVLDAVQRLRVQRLLFVVSMCISMATHDPMWAIGATAGVIVWAVLSIGDEDIEAALCWEDEEDKREMERELHEDWR